MNHSKRPRLGLNIDHIATLRQARAGHYPEPVQAALVAEQAGVDHITLHLRENRRHIQDRDLALIKEIVQAPMNLEMATTAEMLAIAQKYRPAECCLVPERVGEITTEGGLDVTTQVPYLKDFCAELAEAGILVSLFIDADPKQLEAAAAIGATAVELHTGHYALAQDRKAHRQQLDRLAQSIRLGRSLGLQVHAGHSLDYHNVQAVAALEGISALNIGIAIVARAVFTGLADAVRQMKYLIDNA
jgi:pyridoxine 5-phosphate synthase